MKQVFKVQAMSLRRLACVHQFTGKTRLIGDPIETKISGFIYIHEAEFDSKGNLKVYQLPPADGGGTFEVAGINDKYDGPVAYKLRALIAAGQYAQAQQQCEAYYLNNTQAVGGYSVVPGIEANMRDAAFNRGVHGAGMILQMAINRYRMPSGTKFHSTRLGLVEKVKAPALRVFEGMKLPPGKRGTLYEVSSPPSLAVDGQVGPLTLDALHSITNEAIPEVPAIQKFCQCFRDAREAYERMVAPPVGARAAFWQGLVNRWNDCLTFSQSLM